VNNTLKKSLYRQFNFLRINPNNLAQDFIEDHIKERHCHLLYLAKVVSIINLIIILNEAFPSCQLHIAQDWQRHGYRVSA
jgi:hypothetical protein